jgi:hypothetical protein
MIRNLFLFFAVVCLALACTIEETTQFSKDFSGSSTTKVDMNAMVSFMGSMDSTGSGKSKMYRDIQKGLDSANNLEDMKKYKLAMNFDTVNNALSVGFKFKSLDEANEIAKSLSEKQQPGMSMGTKSTYRWQKPGKVLIMPGMEELMAAMGDQSSNPMMQGMTIAISRTFPKNIVKVSDNRFVISNDKKTLTFKASMDELKKNPMKDVTVTFK